MSSRWIDRRTFLAGTAGVLAAAACGSDTPQGLEPAGLGRRFPDGFQQASVAVANNGPQRFPFVVIADDGLPMITGSPASVDIEILWNNEVVEVQTVAARGLGQFTPYYPLEFTPTETGSYVARTNFSEFDVEFLVVDRADTPLFQVGETLPGFDTPTVDDPRGVDPICTRPEQCPFHALTLTEALANDKPTVLMIATPGFCQTDVCGPSVEFLIDAVGDRTDLNVIHAEVWRNYQADIDAGDFPKVAPLAEAWQLEFEPSIFVTDASGTIVGAKHFAFDRGETEDLLDLI